MGGAAQEFVWRSWRVPSGSERNDLRVFLVGMLTAQPASRLVTVKLAKVVVDIAKQEWPAGFPEFLPTIQQLTQNPATLTVGLTLIKTMNEEFTSRRDDGPAARRDELQRVRAQAREWAAHCTRRGAGGQRESFLRRHRRDSPVPLAPQPATSPP